MVRFAILCIGLAIAAVPSTARPVIHHAAHIRFDLDAHKVTVTDTITLPEENCSLQLGRSSIVTIASGIALAEADSLMDEMVWVVVDSMTYTPDRRLVVRYSTVAHESTDDVVFSRENVGREIQATVSDEGIYLAAGSYWLPMIGGAMATHRLTVETPSGWEPVTQGRRVYHEDDGTTLTTIWDAVNPADGLTLVAGPYHVSEQDFDGVTAYTFFLADDPRLVETYMERTGAYLKMYGEMIGPYPYAKFATVENWFPTGYGMPSYTLLGGTVLRLPFIPTTSFGHEIAHNWWGNSAFVAEEGGNWCEGLTVYCADYHYKELESPTAAREYRRNLLKDYAAYVSEDKEMPLSEFESRHSGATRAIGYGKSMMVFHMVDRLLGREAFLGALREVWAGHMYQDVSWNDFMDAFARYGDVDLDGFRRQWLTRPGAPMIRLQSAIRDGDLIRIVLDQDAPFWDLRVPIIIETASGPTEHILEFSSESAQFEIAAPGAGSVAVDPDCHIFRRLHLQEIEPTLSMVFGDDDPAFVVADGLDGAAGRRFADEYVEETEPRFIAAADIDTHSRILINPDAALLEQLLPPGVSVRSGLVFIHGQRFSLKEHAIVMAVARPDAPGTADLVVLGRDGDRVASLGGRIVHYGKYSWLVFPASGRPERGNWPTDDSPLTISF